MTPVVNESLLSEIVPLLSIELAVTAEVIQLVLPVVVTVRAPAIVNGVFAVDPPSSLKIVVPVPPIVSERAAPPDAFMVTLPVGSAKTSCTAAGAIRIVQLLP